MQVWTDVGVREHDPYRAVVRAPGDPWLRPGLCIRLQHARKHQHHGQAGDNSYIILVKPNHDLEMSEKRDHIGALLQKEFGMIYLI